MKHLIIAIIPCEDSFALSQKIPHNEDPLPLQSSEQLKITISQRIPMAIVDVIAGPHATSARANPRFQKVGRPDGQSKERQRCIQSG